jgi:hypothetical protein
MQLFIHSLYLILASSFIQPTQTSIDNSGKNKLSIVINHGVFKINGKTVDHNWSTSFFYPALGKPSKDDDASDLKENFDTKGVVMWKDSDEPKKVSQILVQFANDPDETWYTSKKYFSGSIVIEGLTITSKTTSAELLNKLPDYGFTKNGLDWYEGEFMNVFMYISFDAEEKNLLWIDFLPKYTY